MAWYIIWPGEACYGMSWLAWHGIWYDQVGMAWYVVWPDRHGTVYGMAWKKVWPGGHGIVHGMT